AEPGMGYGTMGIALLVSGFGISLVFPTVANSVIGSVQPPDIGVASGMSTMMQQVGGVFGVSIVASVFARGNEYSSPQHFAHSFSNAILVPAALSAAGVIAALLSSGRAAPPAQMGAPSLGEVLPESADIG
ncbi:MAG TPA: MFS transporter, partial [Streptomyces sp.]